MTVELDESKIDSIVPGQGYRIKLKKKINDLREINRNPIKESEIQSSCISNNDGIPIEEDDEAEQHRLFQEAVMEFRARSKETDSNCQKGNFLYSAGGESLFDFSSIPNSNINDTGTTTNDDSYPINTQKSLCWTCYRIITHEEKEILPRYFCSEACYNRHIQIDIVKAINIGKMRLMCIRPRESKI